jgi:hypothetical protein
MSKNKWMRGNDTEKFDSLEIQLPDLIFVDEMPQDDGAKDLETVAFDNRTPACNTAESFSAKVPLSSIPVNEYARSILLSVLVEIEGLPRLGDALKRGVTWELKQVRDQGIEYKPAKWNGVPLDEAQRQAYSRAVLHLEKFGIVQRITERHRNRVTHVQPTARGLRLALRLVGRSADRLVIADGLRLTNWGKELAVGISIPKPGTQADAPMQQCEQTVQ